MGQDFPQTSEIFPQEFLASADSRLIHKPIQCLEPPNLQHAPQTNACHSTKPRVSRQLPGLGADYHSALVVFVGAGVWMAFVLHSKQPACRYVVAAGGGGEWLTAAITTRNNAAPQRLTDVMAAILRSERD